MKWGAPLFAVGIVRAGGGPESNQRFIRGSKLPAAPTSNAAIPETSLINARWRTARTPQSKRVGYINQSIAGSFSQYSSSFGQSRKK